MGSKKIISVKLALCVILLLFLIVNGCQRQLHFDELPADGTLSKDVSGNCKPVIIGGTFVKNRNLADTNFIVVEVNIKKEGAYVIYTDTINGYWFSASGNFANVGTTIVKMQAHGKPTNVSNDQFTIKFNTSTCSVKIEATEGVAASFSFLGAPDRCRGAVVLGDYIKGVQLNSTNVAKVEVYVTSPGSYSFSSNVVNGYQFSSSGYLPDYGNHILTLNASGSPANTGVDVFTINAGFSSCTIVDTVKDAPPISNLNHFPLTQSSSWTYNDLQFPGDSIRRIIIDSVTIGGKWYKNIEQKDRAATTTLQVRRGGDDYFEYGSADKYTNALTFNPIIKADIPFLKENLVTAATWASVLYTGTNLSGQGYSLRYVYLCTHDDAIVDINGQIFEHVYKVEVRPQIARPAEPLSYTGEMSEYYYAEGIGMIYFRKTANGVTTMQANIRRYKIN